MARLLRILLVEDHNDDAYLFSLVVKNSVAAAGVHWVSDGQEAIDYLEGKGPYKNRSSFPRPDLIVVDLRMHRLSGLEFLGWLMGSRHKQIPAVIWTGSPDPQETKEGLMLGAKAIYKKPTRFQDLVTSIREICAQGRRSASSNDSGE